MVLFLIILIAIVCICVGMISLNTRNKAQKQASLSRSGYSDRQKSNVHQKLEQSREEQIHREKQNIRHNNMNCDKYIFSGRYAETKRIRTKNIAYVWPNESPEDVIRRMGYEDPIEYSFEEWEPMTQKQKEYLYDLSHGKYQTDMSIEDASGMIDRYVQKSYVANPDLFHFADTMRIPVSYYFPFKRLNGYLFQHLEPRDSIAYYCYSVYSRLKKEQIGNMLVSAHKETFYEFADERIEDKSYDFITHINQMQDGEIKSGTKAWKIAKEYLINRGLINS